MLEKDLEKYLVKKVKGLGGLTYKFISPCNIGVPDRIIIIDKRVIFVEVKRENGKLSKAQITQIGKIIDKGVDVFVVKDKEEVDRLITYLDLITIKC